VHHTLYLDTARLGQMALPACDASIDFARFATEHGFTLYGCQLLENGFSSWPTALRRQFPGLSSWEGVPRFQADLRRLAEADRHPEVLLTSRPASLMKFAARLLTGPCRKVLIPDTTWPAYKKILRRELQGSSTEFSVVPIRRKTLRESISSRELIEYLVDEFVRRKCDGLFLPLVDNLGVRLPVEELVKKIRQQAELRFVVVDAAQAMGHVPLRLHADYCDFLLGGSHKWLRAFYTMGIGLFGNPASRDYIAESLQRWRQAGIVDDPLLEFCDELTTGRERPFGETVQVAPLLVANAATGAILSQKPQTAADQQLNRQIITDIARDAGWQSVAPHPTMASRILLFENQNGGKEPTSQDDVRRALLTHGVAATVYSNGLLRLSLPDEPLSSIDRGRLAAALTAANPADNCFVSTFFPDKTLLNKRLHAKQ
jgi:selenocysteine lyase/cysteine desulfurase